MKKYKIFYIDLMKTNFDELNLLSTKYQITMLLGDIIKIKVPINDKEIFNSLTGIIKNKNVKHRQLMTDKEFIKELKNVNIIKNTFHIFSKPIFKKYFKEYGINHIEEIVKQTSKELNITLSKELLDKLNQLKKEKYNE